MIGLRAAGTLGGAAIFGIVAGSWAAIAYVVFFVLGASYRVAIAVWLLRRQQAPASWSGATAATALGAAAAAVTSRFLGHDPTPWLAGYGLAINAAFLLTKTSCLAAGCCGATGHMLRVPVELRHVEIAATAAILGTTAILTQTDPGLAASSGLLAHTGLRLMAHRWMHGPTAPWAPLRQPGVELIPLYLLAALALVL